jgi:hypothetical protein
MSVAARVTVERSRRFGDWAIYVDNLMGQPRAVGK